MPYRRDVLLKLDGSNKDDAEMIRAFYINSGIRELLNHLVTLAASRRAEEDAAWRKVAQRLGKADVDELGHAFFDHISAEVYVKTWVEPETTEESKT